MTAARASVGVSVACRAVSVDYGSVRALNTIDLEVKEGEVLALLGPSGSGKTSLLYAIAGFLGISAGRIEIGGQVVATPQRSTPPEVRSVGMVFQNYALWPHLDAVDTVAYPFRRAGTAKAAARRQAADLLAGMEIGDLGQRRPAQMSGGQQQRLGLARALARSASLYLFDEPTAHLDAGVRQSIQEEVATRRLASGASAIYSTHDSGEALAVADRVAVLCNGALVQVASPREVYEQPVDLDTARLTGPASVVAAEVEESGFAMVEGAAVPVTGTPAVGPATLLVRPEWIIADAGEGIAGTVAAIWYRGPHTDYRVTTDRSTLVVRLPGPPLFQIGERRRWRLSRAHVLA